MRRVAVVAILLAILSFAPPPVSAAAAVDECAAAGPTGCVRIAGSDQGATAVPTIYVYAASLTCTPPGEAQCSGRPWGGGGRPPVGVMGLVYEETNGAIGLQRYDIQLSPTKLLKADTPVLL